MTGPTYRPAEVKTSQSSPMEASSQSEPSPLSMQSPTGARAGGGGGAAAAATAPQQRCDKLTYPVDTTSSDNNNDDDDFAQQMRERTKQRKEREDATLAHLRVQVRRLEAALTAETKRRVAAVAAAQTAAATAVQQVSDEWKNIVSQEQTQTAERLLLLEQRIAQLEVAWQQDVRKLHGRIQTSAESCDSKLTALQDETQISTQARLQREEELLQQINDLSAQYQERWKQERAERKTVVQELTERVQLQEQVRDGQVQALEKQFQEALDQVKTDLQVETAEREEQDQAIVAALNKYTAQVQSSLSFVSGV